MRQGMVIIGFVATTAAWARPKAGEVVMTSPAASSAEIPALASLLAKAGWLPAPELSGVFSAGRIFERTTTGDRLLADDCIAAVPREATYTAVELVTSLQGGVSVGGPLLTAGAYAGIVKKVKFGTPTQVTIPGMNLQLSSSCQESLRTLAPSRIAAAYVVQEVLRAQISEQTCGKVGANGTFVGLGAADTSLSMACSQASLEPVAVGYRIVQLSELLAPAAVAGETAAASTAVRSRSEGADLASSGGSRPNQAPAVAVVAPVATPGPDVQVPAVSFPPKSPAPPPTTAGTTIKRAPPSAASPGAAETESWTGRSGYRMRVVPAGTFTMGCTRPYPKSQTGCPSDTHPAHQVTITHRYAVGETEVTQGLWQMIMKTQPWIEAMHDLLDDGSRACPDVGRGPDLPAYCIRWTDAVRFANALSAREGFSACYTISGTSVGWPAGPKCTGYRLPTEAEWEFAARGGLDVEWAGDQDLDWSRDWNGATAGLGHLGWWRYSSVDKSLPQAHEVRMKKPNNYGFYDMSGNVWEWVWDWYGRYPAEAQINPRAARTKAYGDFHVLRSGSFDTSLEYTTVVRRANWSPRVGLEDFGFRLVRTIGP